MEEKQKQQLLPLNEFDGGGGVVVVVMVVVGMAIMLNARKIMCH